MLANMAVAAMDTELNALALQFGLNYTSGPLGKQYANVLRRINRLALP